MKCTHCNHEIADTAKFCDQCGTPKSPPGDEAIALSIVNAWMVDSEYRSFDEMTSTDKRDARAMLAKARELLVAPLQSEVERLKADRDEAVEAMRVVAEASNANWTFMDRKRSVEEIVKLIATARTAAANARRETLVEAHQLAGAYLVARRPDIEAFVAKLRELRDASQPAAETQTCSEPGCGQCACQSSRVQPSAETQAPKDDIALAAIAFLDGGPTK